MREYDYTPDLDEMDGAGFERRERRLEQINDWMHESAMYLPTSSLGVFLGERYNYMDIFDAVVMIGKNNRLYVADLPFDSKDATYLDYMHRRKVTKSIVDEYLKQEWDKLIPRILSGEQILSRVRHDHAIERKIGWDECRKILRCKKIRASAYDLPGMPDRYYGSQYSIGGYDLLNGQRFLALAIINGEEVWKEMKFFGYERGEHVAGVECDGVEWEPDMINVSGYPEINGQPGMLLPDNADNEEEV